MACEISNAYFTRPFAPLSRVFRGQPKLIILSILISGFLFSQPLAAATIASTHTLETGTVTLANTQRRAIWSPVALLFRFDAPASGTITIIRESNQTQRILAICTLEENQHIIWLAAADIGFNENESLIITTTATNGTVEIIRKGH